MNQNQQVQIKADDKIARGVYSNLFQVAHTKEEFALDFLNVMPPQGFLGARIFVTPGHAKRTLEALKENVRLYEEKFGEIKTAQESNEVGFKIG